MQAAAAKDQIRIRRCWRDGSGARERAKQERRKEIDEIIEKERRRIRRVSSAIQTGGGPGDKERAFQADMLAKNAAECQGGG